MDEGYLWLMALVGVLGTMLLATPFLDSDKAVQKRMYRLAGAWAVIWLGPPLVVLWVRGVFG